MILAVVTAVLVVFAKADAVGEVRVTVAAAAVVATAAAVAAAIEVSAVATRNVCWLLNVPATCECISGTDLRRQFYVLPH